MFSYLIIYRNPRPKFNAYGWKIIDNLEDVNALFEYYGKLKKLDFFINEKISIVYNSYEDLMMDVEVLPITKARAEVLASMFAEKQFGVFPLQVK